jgi:poly-gamma-glutamate synthesis protein (capsule biosynthesis protein)
MGHGVGSAIDAAGPGYVPQATVEHLKGHDLVLANIESPLSDLGRRERSLRSRHMRGRASTAALLRHWGITMGTLANNHVLEHGPGAAHDTARHLRQAGVVPIGTGRDDQFDNEVSVVRLELGGLPLSCIGACTLTETYAHQGYRHWDELTSVVSDERAEGRTVIVALHWGHELIDRPAVRQVAQARDLGAAGATVVAGHHPHVAQGVAMVGPALVAFSLGNFVFNGYVPDTRWSFVLSVELTADGVAGWSTVPVEAGPDHEPLLIDEHLGVGSRAAELRGELARRNERARAVIEGQDSGTYQAEVAALRAASRRMLRRELRSGIGRYEPVMIPQILARPVLRRAGRW